MWVLRMQWIQSNKAAFHKIDYSVTENDMPHSKSHASEPKWDVTSAGYAWSAKCSTQGFEKSIASS